MHYLNILLPRLDTEPFTDATDAQLGCWLRLMALCVRLENNGKIVGAMKWSEKKWNRIGIDEPVCGDSPLWRYENGDLLVEMYPTWHQRRRDSKEAAKLRLRKFRDQKKANGNGHDNADETPVKRLTLHK